MSVIGAALDLTGPLLQLLFFLLSFEVLVEDFEQAVSFFHPLFAFTFLEDEWCRGACFGFGLYFVHGSRA